MTLVKLLSSSPSETLAYKAKYVLEYISKQKSWHYSDTIFCTKVDYTNPVYKLHRLAQTGNENWHEITIFKK